MHRYSLTQKRFWIAAITVALQIGLLGAVAEAKSKDKSKKTEDEKTVGIYVISHTPLPEITVSDIAPVAKPDRQLIELTDNVHGTITVLDVGNPQQPRVTGLVQLPAELAQSSVETRVGGTTLVTAPEGVPTAQLDPQTVTLLSFADSMHPATLQKFEGVTALWQDRGRELIYLTNGEGLWILRIYSDDDKQVEYYLEHRLYTE